MNERSSKMFMETKTVRIVDLWKNHPVRLITNKSVGIDTIVENATGICKTTKYCQELSCNLDDFEFFNKGDILVLPQNRTLSVNQTTRIPCSKTDKKVTVICGKKGYIFPHPTTVSCETEENTIRETPWNKRVRQTCSECYAFGTERCVKVDGGVICQCRQHWREFTCWRSPDMCNLTGLTCGHGKCQSQVDRAVCLCEEEFGGRQCTVNKTALAWYSTTESSILSSQSVSAVALLSTNTVLIAAHVVLSIVLRLNDCSDPQHFWQTARRCTVGIAGLIAVLMRHPQILGIPEYQCRIVFIVVTSLFCQAVGILAIEAYNAFETAMLRQTNNWRVDYFGRPCWSMSPGLRYGATAVMMTSGVLIAFVIEYDMVASKWSCLGRFTKAAIDMWFPITLYHTIACLAATGFSRRGLFVRRYVPQYQQELKEHLKDEPPHRKDEIEKCHRNLGFTAILPWALFGTWLFLAMSSDTVADPGLNFLAVASALVYCCLDVGQFVVTTPTLYSNLMWLEMRFLPAWLAPTMDPVSMWTRKEVLARYRARNAANRRRRRAARRVFHPAYKGYLPKLIREQMKDQWSRAYKDLRKKHRRKTKAQIIDMLRERDRQYLLNNEKDLTKRVAIRATFLQWSARMYINDPEPDPNLWRNLEMELMMEEIDEILRNLRLLNFPTSRTVTIDEDENKRKQRPRVVTIPKCVIPVIDAYGYTHQQAVLPTPIELIRPEDIPSTSSERRDSGNVELGLVPRRDSQEGLDKETLKWLKEASDTVFEMAVQNEDYLDRVKALRSWN